MKRAQDQGDDQICFGKIEDASQSALKDVHDLIMSIANESMRLQDTKVDMSDLGIQRRALG